MPLINESAHYDSQGPKELWRPSKPQETQMYDFMTKASQKYGIPFENYGDLWRWSISESSQFWEEIWHYTSIKAHGTYDRVRT